LSFAALAFLVVVATSACGASVDLQVDVGPSGSGSVALQVSFPKATAAQIEDLKAGLSVADLRADGWVVVGPKPGPGGGTVVSASHTFAKLAQLPALVADIAGSGPEDSRPFRLSVTKRPGLLQDHYTATGMVDLRCGLSCFDDPLLAASVGYPLGVAPSEVRRLFGAHPGSELTFRFNVVLPGTVTSSDATERSAGGGFVWAPVLGKATTVLASTETENTPVIRALAVAVGAAVLLVLLTVALFVRRRRRRRRRGLRFGGRQSTARSRRARSRRARSPNRGKGRYA
jgi:hypothetical protein